MDFDQERDGLIEHLRCNGIDDERVLAAMRRVARHVFVPESLCDQAYQDSPLPIGGGQTISQPLVVALMTAALRLEEGDVILEVGTGSGYQTAILAELCHRVVSIERDPELAARAAAVLDTLGYKENRVQVHTGDGSLGWPPEAPYGGILVAAGAPKVPPSLLSQLADGGHLVIPVGTLETQTLRVITRDGPEFLSSGLGHVRFVPLIGGDGWSMGLDKGHQG